MKLRIQHVTRYRYAEPVAFQPHRLMMFPRGSHELQVLDSSLGCTPAAVLEWSRDVFDNLIATATFAGSADELVISSEAEVELTAPAWPVFPIATGAHSYPFDYSEDDRRDLQPLLQPAFDDPDGRLEAWARGFVFGTPTDTLSLLKDVNAGVSAPVSYRVRDEEGTQAPLATLHLASGSCRDIAALFIDTVRHLGFAARAVSGYLFDPTLPADEEGSTHAWAEVYLPGAGWIAFDPTHGRVGSANLIPVAVGFCNRQIMPVTGGYLGTARDFVAMEVRVTMIPAGEESVAAPVQDGAEPDRSGGPPLPSAGPIELSTAPGDGETATLPLPDRVAELAGAEGAEPHFDEPEVPSFWRQTLMDLPGNAGDGGPMRDPGPPENHDGDREHAAVGETGRSDLPGGDPGLVPHWS